MIGVNDESVGGPGVDGHLVGDVARLVDTNSYGWAGLRRWLLDRGSPAASAGEVRQLPGTRGYRLQRIFSGTRRLSSLPAVYDVLDTSGQAWLRVELERAPMSRTAPAQLTVHGAAGGVAVVPSVRTAPMGAGLTLTAPDGAPLLVVPGEPGLSWSALDPAGLAVARVEHVASRAGWVDRRNRSATSVLRGGRPGEDELRSGDVITFERSAGPLHRALVLGLAICRAHVRA